MTERLAAGWRAAALVGVMVSGLSEATAVNDLERGAVLRSRSVAHALTQLGRGGVDWSSDYQNPELWLQRSEA